MLSFPNCKINLGLQILNKREDGYHNLATVFYPLPLKDALELVRRDDRRWTTDDSKTLSDLPSEAIAKAGVEGPAGVIERSRENDVIFSSTGLEIAGDQANNLCVKAYHLLKKDFPSLPPVLMHLHKAIPMGAGLGGGSADGAFALKLLNEKFQLNLTNEQLIAYALQLGSDCPFFIHNKPCYATGRGELLEPIQLDLSAYKFAVVNPGIHVNTGWAFANLSGRSADSNKQSDSSKRPDSEQRPNLKQIIQQPISTWKQQLTNDFEAPVCKAHPEIATIKQQLYDAGAVYASMSGSGSTVFGIFEKEPELKFDEKCLLQLI
ncbi:4-diphosphocytidyl-2-C-methyl-D-erythritol kinase [Lacibacter cauensis]|uniref:4-diphosphocytidyl-2-C-methyl-D-erythritol kinase n=1 Tax=Lacibacter cauensis TaxID=510947 RepID=A0A562SIA1_9BACT|nr:4-(cytidine 5'-diphospho)-2-C-methyl-D-erythritol kinase [Lacibacter cauensis]TWI80496.1 4-diphosphocytidyl-2-C-methyl-D-erythritol kinase [Lacibacter cauensis]